MSEKKFVQFNIAFQIPEDVAKVSMKLSNEIAKKEDAYFVLDGVNYLSHITNYSVVIPNDKVDKMFETIEKLVKNFSPIEFIFNKRSNAKFGWICVFFDCSQEIRSLHETIVYAINPLRERKIKDRIEENFSDEQSENIEKYGNPNIMDLYDPHITITRLKDFQIAEKVASEIKWEVKKFKADAIGVFVSGEHGTCRKLVREFKLI